MSKETIDGLKLKQMILGGASSLDNVKEEINALNVFPVPDGDTGTNMNLTIQSAKKEIEKVDSNHAGEVAKALSKGALMGARGNSGVILSQLFRGFSKILEDKSEVDGKLFVKGLTEGVNTAYKAVMKPVEGTILTVAKDASKEGQRYLRDTTDPDLTELLERVITKTKESVEKTPQQLPVLKEAGVVDAGGKGLYYIYTGFLLALTGELDVLKKRENGVTAFESKSYESPDRNESLVYQYCTELMISNVESVETTESELKADLATYGDSLVIVGSSDIVKVHIHTNRPGYIIEKAMNYGEINDIKIDNMKDQHHSLVLQQGNEANTKEDTDTTVEDKNISVIAVASGEGFSNIFKSMGVENVVVGGQTMNPSTEDFVNAINKASSDKVILLANNKNIIMACEQAKEISEKEVAVIPTKTIPQGISALLAYNPDGEDLAKMTQEMIESSNEVVSGQVTYAVRDANFESMNISEGDIIAIIDGEIKSFGDCIEEVLKEALKKSVTDEHEIITLFYGKDVESKTVKNMVREIEGMLPECDVEYHFGGQPLYYYTFAIE
ncbi:DAK2 domain-containing protein [Natranaerobius trueperi]|uniref:Dihydroxyacetone kinase n=1 Tax=Natranaerobius trueperi TaxID=759412 RepID=A0A226BYU5_9FIRM|nr:DAK2 domain-containing protein [Natranaerobius trueperi]OWZ84176.1 dihydroxyacetone kinase [Natranaerobius trueperi]